MRRTITVKEAQERLAEVLEGVRASGDEVTIERDGQAVAVVVPVTVYERVEQGRDEFLDLLDRVGSRNPDISEDDLNADIEEAIREYRAEQRAARSE